MEHLFIEIMKSENCRISFFFWKFTSPMKWLLKYTCTYQNVQRKIYQLLANVGAVCCTHSWLINYLKTMEMEKRICKLLLTNSYFSGFAFWGTIYSYFGCKCLVAVPSLCAMHNCNFYGKAASRYPYLTSTTSVKDALKHHCSCSCGHSSISKGVWRGR